MPPEKNTMDGRERGPDEYVRITHEELNILTLIRGLSDSDKDYLCRVLDALVLTSKTSLE